MRWGARIGEHTEYCSSWSLGSQARQQASGALGTSTGERAAHWGAHRVLQFLGFQAGRLQAARWLIATSGVRAGTLGSVHWGACKAPLACSARGCSSSAALERSAPESASYSGVPRWRVGPEPWRRLRAMPIRSRSSACRPLKVSHFGYPV